MAETATDPSALLCPSQARISRLATPLCIALARACPPLPQQQLLATFSCMNYYERNACILSEKPDVSVMLL